MNTAKYKAEQLVDKMYYSRKYKDGEDYIPQEAWVHAKECALIAVDEIINECGDRCLFSKCDYWEEVKSEIEKI